ncbi:MAG: hypothetical protein IGR93_05675 [Hydrococcus sp. C42_A2020_068]|nr:hypothetical protein [Hydrococcus sp. C42_A2020_068]
MSQEPAPIARTQRKQKLSDRVRSIADRLKQETEVQIKTTSRILSAAAKIAENHDRLIDEVVDMVEEDIDRQTQVHQKKIYTVDLLKQQFKTLREAKAHFRLKASSWAELVKKLNSLSAPNPLSVDRSKISVPERLNAIESELKIMRTEIGEILSLLKRHVLNKE